VLLPAGNGTMNRMGLFGHPESLALGWPHDVPAVRADIKSTNTKRIDM
jgi:hypothetical protein